MDLDKAMMVHADWLRRFRTAIDERTALDAATICKDDACELGQWLHGDGHADHAGEELFEACVAAHAAFHEQAGHLAVLINDCRYEMAQDAMQVGTPYRDAANAVALAVLKLKNSVARAA